MIQAFVVGLCVLQIDTLNTMADEYTALKASLAAQSSRVTNLTSQVSRVEASLSTQVADVRTELLAEVDAVSKMPGPPVSCG